MSAECLVELATTEMLEVADFELFLELDDPGDMVEIKLLILYL